MCVCGGGVDVVRIDELELGRASRADVVDRLEVLGEQLDCSDYHRAGLRVLTQTLCNTTDPTRSVAQHVDEIVGILRFATVVEGECLQNDERARTAHEHGTCGTFAGERGAIVNMTSVAAFDGQIGQAAYSSSKGGVVGLTLPVARDLSAVGIRVNTVAPGLIDTPIYGEGEAAEQFKEKLSVGTLFPKRLGKPAEYASLAIELLRNSYINGESVRIDSGMRMQPK